MQDVKDDLLIALNRIKGNGSFVTSHDAPFVFPGLSIDGLGEIAYPINEIQAKALIKKAEKAPFGKGSETIVDSSVRSAWEIDSSEIQFKGEEWGKFLKTALKKIKPELGIEDYEVEARLYKMLIYEKGDFFLPHRDSEKEKGMFGTLIIGLPSKFMGGELVVRFDGEEKAISFAEVSAQNKLAYTAFYADCEHEIKPLTDGYRVCLVYNLLQKQMNKEIRLEPIGEHVDELAAVLRRGFMNSSFSPGILLLGHQYTPENFSMQQLKLNDRTRAMALLRAADKAGYYAKMCLVTSHLSGIPSYDGYGYDDESDENATMEEVYDDELYIENWLEDGVPPLRNVQFEEKDLMASFHLNEEEPIVKESSGYMGNYGPDLLFWYHYGAVFFWPKGSHAEILLTQDVRNQLEWIEYYNSIREKLSDEEVETCEKILQSIDEVVEHYDPINYNAAVDWLTGYKDDACFEKLGYSLLQTCFLKINEQSWTKLLEAYPAKHIELIFDSMAKKKEISVIWHILTILKHIADNSSEKGLIVSQLQRLPSYFGNLSNVNANKALVNKEALICLLELEMRWPQDEAWVDKMKALLTENKSRKYINQVFVEEVLKLEKLSPLSKALLLVGHDELQKRVHNVPEPPADWTRPVPKSSNYENQWKELAAFLKSPVEEIFDYRRNQSDRTEMELAIQNAKVDLRFETIKKGSPHTLRISKTKATYENQMKKWHEDVVLLEAVNNKIS